MKKYLPLLLSAILICSCKSTKVEKTTFNGMIYDANSEPVNGATIYIDGDKKAVTDMYGRFYIDNLEVNSDYLLSASKIDYETAEFHFKFQNISQVIYITMYSHTQLLEKAEQALSEKNITLAESFVSRAENCNGNSLSSDFLKAVILYNKKEYRNALLVLSKMLENGEKNPYIYLFMADIYEYELDNIDLAKDYLQKYLSSTYDLDIEKRYQNLCSQ